ncbi:MAG: hypothetical protein WCC17_16595 [Candidatus Nitrosopolaris sp.]
MEMEQKMCSQCACWDFTNDEVREGESTTKQEGEQGSPKPKSCDTSQPIKSPQSVRDDLDTEIQEIKEEFRTHFTKCKELVKRLGDAIKRAGIVKESDICHEVKNVLAEEIAAQDITVRTVDRYCLDEWKKITKPKKKKDNLSFSPPAPSNTRW